MKRIVQIAVVALSCSAGAVFAEQERETPQAADNEMYISVAQASQNGEAVSIQREAPAVKQRKLSLHEEIGLAGEGAFPSRGGPLDD